MSKFIQVLFFFFGGFFGFSQEVSIEMYTSELLRGLDNPIEIKAPNCQNLYLESSIGSSVRDSTKCQFFLRPKELKNVEILIKNERNELVFQKELIVRDIQFDLRFNGLNTENLDKYFASARLYLTSPDLSCYDLIWNVSYDLIHIQGYQKKEFSLISKNGNLEKFRKQLFPLKKNDIILLKNIKLIINNLDYYVSDLEIKI
jgi:hypothetical protein